VVLDCCFSDRELVGDLLIGIAFANQANHINFARTQLIVGGVFSQLRRVQQSHVPGNLIWNMFRDLLQTSACDRW
jgi:hypothetical protein